MKVLWKNHDVREAILAQEVIWPKFQGAEYFYKEKSSKRIAKSGIH